MALLTTAVFGRSRKQAEKRVPIHPDQLVQLDPVVRKQLFFETGYGLAFGMDDEKLAHLSGGIRSRQALLDQCDIALLAKPVAADFSDMRKGTIHWGWPHCVQQRAITQTAIDHKLTLIAWEAMHAWSEAGEWQGHTFYRNNEIAGYAGVQHAMNLMGIDGTYGPGRKAVVISFGSVSQGAVRGLQARGVNDITVFTPKEYVVAPERLMDGVAYYTFTENESGQLVSLRSGQDQRPFVEELVEADLIVNGILQDTDHPLLWVPEDQNDRLKPGCLIVDVSCDEGMGFSFAKPTTFAEPIFQHGEVFYYAVDHTPSYLWNAASWEIAKAVLAHLPTVMAGPEAWATSETIRRAIEIRNGVIQNPKILSFQNRAEAYPHREK